MKIVTKETPPPPFEMLEDVDIWILLRALVPTRKMCKNYQNALDDE